jgi:hypothetical protein
MDRFWSKVRKDGENCWLWTGSAAPRGYGRLKVGKACRLATHVALELDGRPRPSPDHLALHSCDNPTCVNPSHLRWGTQKENVADMFARGRASDRRTMNHARGERVHTAKLTDAQVRVIFADTRPTAEVARDFGVHPDTIRQIRNGEKWRHLGLTGETWTDRLRRLRNEKITAVRDAPGTQMEIARRFGVTQGWVSAVKLGKVR